MKKLFVALITHHCYFPSLFGASLRLTCRLRSVSSHLTVLGSLFTLFLSGCSRPENYVTFSGLAQGTTWSIVVGNPAAELQSRIEGVFDTVDGTFSMFNPSSLTSRIDRGETDAVTPLFEECFAIAQAVHERSGGYYDITVKPLVDAWGFGPGKQQEKPCVDCLMEYVGMDKVNVSGGRITKTDPRLQLDFSSVAKGFTVDLLAELLDSEGARNYMVDVGGEVRVRGVNNAGRPWRIGIDKPVAGFSRELAAVAVPTPSLPAIATSGNYRQYFTDERGRVRVHTIDPTTGYPASGDVLSVSIAAADCGTADAWATALMAAHNIETVREILATNREIFYYIIYSPPAGPPATLHSPGFPLSE